MGEKLVLLDGYSLMYRAYHGLQAPMSAPDGTPTNAVHAFMMMLIKILAEEKPDGIAAAFDMHAPTLRAQRYAQYKATRKPMPDDLRVQDPIIRTLLAQMHIPILEKEGYEGDDILGTLSAHCEARGCEALIVTGDRDSFQLAGPHTTILYTKRGITDTMRVTPEYIRETYGLEPVQMIDVKGLMGDASDNIPGIAGIGEKTALKLIGQYGTLENALSRAFEQKGKLRQRLEEGVDAALLSKELATIDRAVPLDYDVDDLGVGALLDAVPHMKQLGLFTASGRLTDTAALFAAAQPQAEDTAQAVAVEALDGADALREMCAALPKVQDLAFYAEAERFTLCADGRCVAVALCTGDLLGGGVSEEDCYAAVRPLLGRARTVCVYDVKALPFDRGEFAGALTDVMLAAYARNPGRGSFALKDLCESEGIAGFDHCPAEAALRLGALMNRALAEEELTDVYEKIELPLAFVLRGMEQEGVQVDAGVLEDIGAVLRANIERTVAEINVMTGKTVNLNSPKQLGTLLFEEMGLPAPKKTARGWSTSAQVLEELADDYPICAKILEYRKNQKLESTYIRALLLMRDETGRIHSRFDQVGTATGRISSLEPNLQNIPVRTELGRGIRRAFVAKEGCVLVDADYSQIELRVLAHISEDATMIDSFVRGQDIHRRTAAEVYGVPIDEVTDRMRTATKAVNFGIVYGISDFALAKNIGVSRHEAREFIDRYFQRYPGVKRYMEQIVRKGRENGYVATLMGRRRYLPELHSANFNVRSFAERCAMNSPIQGTAADIIKMAMNAVAARLSRDGFKARLILQVHDELIIEAPLEEQAAVETLLREEMENVMTLKVPLRADVHAGGDWGACK